MDNCLNNLVFKSIYLRINVFYTYFSQQKIQEKVLADGFDFDKLFALWFPITSLLGQVFVSES